MHVYVLLNGCRGELANPARTKALTSGDVRFPDLPVAHLTIYSLIHMYASMHIQEMNHTADQVCEIMTLLSNRSRLMILCLLTDGEKSVGELAESIGARETAVSQQLAVLRRERIVKARREGQTMFYRIIRDDVGELLSFLYDTYCGGMDGKKENYQ